MDISYKLLKNGFEIIPGITDKRYFVKYPNGVFEKLGKKDKAILAENFSYARIRNLSFIQKENLNFSFSNPFWKNFTDWGILNDLPRISHVNKVPATKLVKDFKSSRNSLVFKGSALCNSLSLSFFSGNEIKEQGAGNAVLAMSFGKDSLLSYGLAKETGLNVKLVFVKEMDNKFSFENNIKQKIIKEFCFDQKEKINFLYDNVDEIFREHDAIIKLKELDNSNGMLAFCLELLPFAYYFKAKYIIMGNEQNLNDSFLNRYKVKAYPSFDQTTFYNQKENQLLRKFSGNSLKAISLVEPLYNIAEMKILYNRYPELLKYVMSCEPEKGKSKWCYNCSTCAEAYMYSMAFKQSPKRIGFNKNLFGEKYWNLFPLFNKKREDPYDRPLGIGEGEMLAFLMAYQNGASGGLMELFKKKFLRQAKAKEAYLKKEYFGIHKMVNIPAELKSKLLKIFHQELNQF